MVARGEIWWHEAPEEKRRPHLILTRNEGISVLTQVLAVPATRVTRSIPSEVLLGPNDGMPVQCVLSLDNTRTVRLSHLTHRITALSPQRLTEVCNALGFVTRCA